MDEFKKKIDGIEFSVSITPNEQSFKKLWAGKKENGLVGVSTEDHVANLSQLAFDAIFNDGPSDFWEGYGPVEGYEVYNFLLELLYDDGGRAAKVYVSPGSYMTDKTEWPKNMLDEWINSAYPSIEDRDLVVDPLAMGFHRKPEPGDNNRIWWREVINTIRNNWDGSLTKVHRDVLNKIVEIRKELGYEGGIGPSRTSVLRQALTCGVITRGQFDAHKLRKMAIRNDVHLVRDDIIERDGHKCLCCGSRKRLEVDHIVPVSLGGDSSNDNLQTLCKKCNRKKYTFIISFRHLSTINGHSKKDVLPKRG